jgi:hypothetical protein
VAAELVGAAALAAVLGVSVFAQASDGGPTSVPANVMTAFRQSHPGAVVVSTAQGREAGRTVFRIESRDGGRRRVVVYSQEAAVVEVAEHVEERDLPAPVSSAMHSHPRAIYVSGMKVSRQGDVQYQLTLRGTRKTAMVVKPDGTVLSFK